MRFSPKRVWLAGRPIPRLPLVRTGITARLTGPVAVNVFYATLEPARCAWTMEGENQRKPIAKSAGNEKAGTEKRTFSKRGWKTARLLRSAGDITQLRQRGGLLIPILTRMKGQENPV